MHRKPLLTLGLFLPLLLAPSCGRGPSAAAASGADVLAEVDGLLREGRADDALARLAAPDAAGLPAAEAALRRAAAQVARGEIPKAVRVAKEALAAHPDATPIALLLADVYIDLGQYEPAVDVLREARANGADDGTIALTLGVCLGRMRDLAGARAEFERARAAGVERAEVDYNLAILLIEEGDGAEAERLLRGLLELEPQHPFAGRELARVLLSGAVEEDARVAEAADLVNLALDRDPADWRAYELIGDVSMLRGDVEAAVVYYTEALRHGRNPVRVEDKFRVAEAQRQQMLIAQGVLEPPTEARGGPPPIPQNLQDRWDRARVQRQQQAAEDWDAVREADAAGAAKPSGGGEDGGGDGGR